MSKESLKNRREKLVEQKDKTEVYSRIVGYYRNVRNWNTGKKQEFKDREEYVEGNIK